MADQPPSAIDGVKNFFSSTFGGLFGRPSGPDLSASTNPAPGNAALTSSTVGNRQQAQNPPTRPLSGSTGAAGAKSPPPARAPGAAPPKGTPKKKLEEGWMMIDDDFAQAVAASTTSNAGFDQTVSDEPNSDSTENVERFSCILSETKVNVDFLRHATWEYGVPSSVRATVWKILLDIVPPWPYLHPKILSMKREYYLNYCKKFLKMVDSNEEERQLILMIRSGLQATALKIKTFSVKALYKLLERVIYIWLKQNPTVQFMNGFTQVALPVLYICLSEYGDVKKLNAEKFSAETLRDLEADCYLILAALFDKGLKDLFTLSPDVHIQALKQSVKLSNPDLYMFLAEMDIQYMTFAYPWLESMMVDVIQKIPLVVQMWDRYIVSNKFAQYHIILTAKVLERFAKQIAQFDSAVDVYHFLEHLPLHKLNYAQVDRLLGSTCGSCVADKLVTLPKEIDLEPVLTRWRKKHPASAPTQLAVEQTAPNTSPKPSPTPERPESPTPPKQETPTGSPAVQRTPPATRTSDQPK